MGGEDGRWVDMDLDAIEKLSNDVVKNVYTFNVGLSSCSIPGRGPSFHMDAGDIEFGLGIHGEKGLRRTFLPSANILVAEILRFIEKASSPFSEPERVVVMVNYMTGTTPMEAYIVANEIFSFFSARPSITIERCYVGSFMTALDMKGLSITILRRLTPLQLKLLDFPTSAPAWPTQTHQPLVLDDDIIWRPSSCLSSSSSISSFSSSSSIYHVEDNPLYPRLSDTKTSSQVRSILRRICEKFVSPTVVALLNNLDSEIGDGDCGSAFCRGATEILLHIETINCQVPAIFLAQLAHHIHRSMAGSSGALLAAFFHRASTAAFSTICIGDLISAGVSAIQEVGGGTLGDKTLLDSLIPASLALLSSPEDWKAAAHASAEGALSTLNMISKRGRSANLNDRNFGHIDPGSQAISLIFSEIFSVLYS